MKKSLALSILIFFLCLPLLAKHPQSGDGAEFLNTALRGGVLHPPGFPLQAWINRIFVRIPGLSPATGLSVQGLLCHCLMILALLEGLRALRCRWEARALAALSCACYGPMLYTSVQPEVFALTYALMAGVYFIFIKIALAKNPGTYRHMAIWGIVTGLAGVQHSISILTFPILLTGLFISVKNRRNLKLNQGPIFLGLGLAGLTLLGFFLSLPLLRSSVVWPDWGHLDSVQSIVDHVLRKEFGTFSLAPGSASNIQWRGLYFFFGQMLRGLPLGLAAVFWYGAKARQELVTRTLLMSLGVAFIFLFVAKSGASELFARATLERFDGVALLPLTLLLGLSLEKILACELGRYRRPFFAACVIFFALVPLLRGFSEANAAQDNTLEIFREALSISLPADSLYIGTQSEEYFYGVENGAGAVRFPAVTGLFLERSWYVREVLPKIEPRIDWQAGMNASSVLKEAKQKGIGEVASLDHRTFNHSEWIPELRGLLYVARPVRVADTEFTRQTLHEALKYCPLIARLNALPLRSHGYSHQLRTFFSRAFLGASRYLSTQSALEASLAANRVALALQESARAEDWIQSCQRLGQTAGAL